MYVGLFNFLNERKDDKMGAIVEITCTSCKAKWKRKTGCGIWHADLNEVANLYPENIKRKIKKYAEKIEFPIFDFEYRLSSCISCHNIQSIPVLHLRDDDIKYIGPCEQCGEKTELIDTIENTHCPICGKVSLKSKDIGQWD